MISKYIYLEFLQLVKDYFVTLKKKELFFEWFIPLIIGLIFYFFSNINNNELHNFIPTIVNVLAILVGFSIATITILSTTSSQNVNNLKKIISDRKIGNKQINLYQLIMITFSFILFIEIILLIFNLLICLFSISLYYKILFGINIFFMLHILLLNIRNITNIYFIFYREKEDVV